MTVDLIGGSSVAPVPPAVANGPFSSIEGLVGTVSAIDTGLGQPALALIGRRNTRFIEAWVWHRSNLYSLSPTAPVIGTVVLENVPAGSWKISWWDTQKGVASESSTVSHPGGTLRIVTPPITRHAALVLTQNP